MIRFLKQLTEYAIIKYIHILQIILWVDREKRHGGEVGSDAGLGQVQCGSCWPTVNR